jgi:hypothetical protein
MDSFHIFVYTTIIHGFFPKDFYKKYLKMIGVKTLLCQFGQVDLDLSTWLGCQFGPSCQFDWQSDKLFD